MRRVECMRRLYSTGSVEGLGYVGHLVRNGGIT